MEGCKNPAARCNDGTMRREWLQPPFGEIVWDYFFFAFFSAGSSTMRLCSSSGRRFL